MYSALSELPHEFAFIVVAVAIRSHSTTKPRVHTQSTYTSKYLFIPLSVQSLSSHIPNTGVYKRSNAIRHAHRTQSQYCNHSRNRKTYSYAYATRTGHRHRTLLQPAAPSTCTHNYRERHTYLTTTMANSTISQRLNGKCPASLLDTSDPTFDASVLSTLDGGDGKKLYVSCCEVSLC